LTYVDFSFQTNTFEKWLFADYSGSSQEHQARRSFHGKDLRVVFASECLADFQVFSPSANF